MTQAFFTGDFTGENRPMARLTIQQGRVGLHRSTRNTYSSIVFNNSNTPLELPNVVSIRWDRSVDTDSASCVIRLWNTEPLGPGDTPFNSNELDLPGYYTVDPDDPRFGRYPNALARLLQPDNVIHSFEGYGWTPGTAPDKDPRLVSTGVWLIDDVVVDESNPAIEIRCRDLARILIDQISYKPVVPTSHYPLRFTAVDSMAGFRPPTVVSNVGYGGQFDPRYTGPVIAPEDFAAVAGNGGATLSWSHPSYPPPELALPAEHQGGQFFRAPSGYFVRFPSGEWYACNGPGQVNAARYLYGQWTNTQSGAIGTVVSSLAEKFGGGGQLERYIPRFQPIQYKVYVSNQIQPNDLDESATATVITGLRNGNIYAVSVAALWQAFESGIRVTGLRSVPVLVRPSGGGPAVTPGTISVSGRDVSWSHGGSGVIQWTVIQYRGTGVGGDFSRTTTITSSSPSPTLTIPAYEGAANEYSYLVYGSQAGQVGAGDVLLAVQGEASLYDPPPAAMPPSRDETVIPGGGTGNPDQVIPRDTVPVGVTHRASTPGGTGAHNPLRPTMDSYWESPSAPSPDSIAYWEADVPNVTLSKVVVHTSGSGYRVSVSVYADGNWVAYAPTNIIQTNAPGLRIPWLDTTAANTEGPINFYFREPIANITRVRITAGNFQPRPGSNEQFSFRLRRFEAHTPRDPSANQTGLDDTIREARVVGGAGDNPGTYSDYTDIVKLLCAWGGFFWPQDGTIRSADGSDTPYNFGEAPYNLGPNVDPVLGEGSGRVWGDFEIAGVAGITDLLVNVFDKRPLMDGINYVRDILGFIFYIDEDGAVVWRSLNVFRVGNYTLNRSARPGFTLERVILDERQNLMSMTQTRSSKNVRDWIYVSSADASVGYATKSFNPNPIGLRRVAGWSDQGFQTDLECAVMAQMIAIRQMFTYRTNRVTIPAYPRIQVNDQVQIRARITQEDNLHYVSGITSNNDLVEGKWIYDLDTHWLGTDPQQGDWALDTQGLLAQIGSAVRTREAAAGIPPLPSSNSVPVNPAAPAPAPEEWN